MTDTSQKPIETDLFIVGGGPAGLAAGIAAKRQGLEVVIADCADLPVDKACGEGLMPDGLAALSRIGVEIPMHEGYVFTGIRFAGAGRKSTADFRNGFGLGMRRVKLQALLAESARRAGVQMLWRSAVQRTPSGQLTVNGTPVSSRWIVGADGQKSRVRDWAGIHAYPGEQIRFGFRCHFQAAPWTNCVEVNWGPDCEVVVTPVSSSEICVALMTRNPKLDFDAGLSLFPELHRRLMRAPRSTTLRGGLSVQRTLRTVVNGKFILVGDASGSVDAITGEGMCLSFQQAECLAEALAKNDLDLYIRGHRRIRRTASIMARLMLFMDRVPSVGNAVLRIFEAHPGIFSAFLAAHLGQSSLAPSVRHFGGAPSEVPMLPNISL